MRENGFQLASSSGELVVEPHLSVCVLGGGIQTALDLRFTFNLDKTWQ